MNTDPALLRGLTGRRDALRLLGLAGAGLGLAACGVKGQKAAPPKPAAAVHHPSQTGLAKSWSDARGGFADVLEWLLARSGAALIVLLAAIALLYGVRYLYPIVRRGLV